MAEIAEQPIKPSQPLDEAGQRPRRGAERRAHAPAEARRRTGREECRRLLEAAMFHHQRVFVDDNGIVRLVDVRRRTPLSATLCGIIVTRTGHPAFLHSNSPVYP